MIGKIQFSPLDRNGNPAVLDGPLSFSLAPGNELLATLLPSIEDNSVEVQAIGAGEISIIASGDVRLDDVVAVETWSCSAVLYEPADHLNCELVSLRPAIDE